MEKEFVPENLVEKLKELGYNGPIIISYILFGEYKPKVDVIQRITFSQAFRWFREKYGLYGIPQEYTLDNFSYQIKSNREGAITFEVYGGYPLNYTTYEEAELACIDKLLTLAESK